MTKATKKEEMSQLVMTFDRDHTKVEWEVKNEHVSSLLYNFIPVFAIKLLEDHCGDDYELLVVTAHMWIRELMGHLENLDNEKMEEYCKKMESENEDED